MEYEKQKKNQNKTKIKNQKFWKKSYINKFLKIEYI